MAELHRVEINEKAPQEIDPESEESVEAVPEEQTEDNRPEWLPEKFKSPEDMASAYSELEKKMGAGVEQEKRKNLKYKKKPMTLKRKTWIVTILLWKLLKSSFKMMVSYLRRPMRILLKLGYRRR